MLQHPAQDVARSGTLTVPGFVDRPGGVLVPAHLLPGRAATSNVGVDRVDQGTELHLVVEGRDNDVPPFVPGWVVSVVPHHKTPDAVVRDVDDAQDRRLGPSHLPRP